MNDKVDSFLEEVEAHLICMSRGMAYGFGGMVGVTMAVACFQLLGVW